MMPMMTEEYNGASTSNRRGAKNGDSRLDGEYGMNAMELDQGGEGDSSSIINSYKSFLPQDKILQGALVGGVMLFLLIIIKLVHVTSAAAASNPAEGGEGHFHPYNPYHRDIDPQWRVRPSNLHLVILGDSISHYQYLSLVYFLRTGRWFDPSFRKSHLTNVYSYENAFHDDIYGEFFFQTVRLLQPNEICDCVYPKGSVDQYRLGAHRVIINRYFQDEERNNTVRFFHAFGHEHDMQGRLTPSNVTDMQGKEHDELLNGKHAFDQKDVVWTHPDWAEVIRKEIGSLSPKPEYVVLNAGKHDTDFVEDESKVTDLSQSLQDIGIIKAYWRTATFRRGGDLMLDENPVTDELMCGAIGNCLNVSWTKDVSELMYWDETHNWEPVYRVMNEDLLEAMGFLPNGYVKFNRSLLL